MLDPQIVLYFLDAATQGNVAVLKHLSETFGQKYLNCSQDNHGNTLLHIAAQHGFYEVCEYLFSIQDFPYSIPNAESHTAYELIPYSNQHLIALFQTYGAHAPTQGSVITFGDTESSQEGSGYESEDEYQSDCRSEDCCSEASGETCNIYVAG